MISKVRRTKEAGKPHKYYFYDKARGFFEKKTFRALKRARKYQHAVQCYTSGTLDISILRKTIVKHSMQQ
jgi:hypothetical protein